MATRRKDVAKAYITYRHERDNARKSPMDKTFIDFLSGKSEYWNTENSNKDEKVVTTQRDYIAGIASTDLARRFILPKEVCEAHDLGIIHQHDMDYMAQRALNNCCLVNLEDMLRNGTAINGIKIDSQNRITTAATVATQIIAAVASSQYGGTTITLSHLAPYVRYSFYENYCQGMKYIRNKEIDNSINRETEINSELYLKDTAVYEYAFDMTKKDVKDSVQTFNYQTNSMSTTNG